MINFGRQVKTRAEDHNETEKAGTGPSRRHIQGSKIAKRLPSVKYSLLEYSKIENFTRKKFSRKVHAQKNGPSGAPKGGHFRNCQHFCRS